MGGMRSQKGDVGKMGNSYNGLGDGKEMFEGWVTLIMGKIRRWEGEIGNSYNGWDEESEGRCRNDG